MPTRHKIGTEWIITDKEFEYSYEIVNSYIIKERGRYQALSVPIQGHVTNAYYKTFDEALNHFGENTQYRLWRPL